MDISWIFSGISSLISFLLSAGVYVFYSLGIYNAAKGVDGLKVPIWCAWIPFAKSVLLADIIAQKGPKKLANMEFHVATIVALAVTVVLAVITCGALLFLPFAVVYALNIMFVYYYAPEDKKVLYYILMIFIYPVGMFLAPKDFGLTDKII